MMKLPRSLAWKILFVALCHSPVAAYAQDLQCSNPSAGRGGTPAERSAKVHNAAEAAANANPPDPCLGKYLEWAGSLAPVNVRIQENQRAIELLRGALARAEMTWGADSQNLVPFLSGLVSQLVQFHPGMELLPEAENLNRRAMAITEMAYGPDDMREVPLLLSLASFVDRASGLRGPQSALQSLPLDERVLAIEERNYGPESPRLVSTLFLIGGQYWNQSVGCGAPSRDLAIEQQRAACSAQNLAKSDAALVRAVEVSDAQPSLADQGGGVQGPMIVMALQMLLRNYSVEHRIADAEDIYRHLIRTQTGLTGPASQEVCRDYQLLAALYQSDHDYASARITLLQALEVAQRLPPGRPIMAVPLMGPGLPAVSASPAASILENLASLAFDQKDNAQGKDYAQQEVDWLTMGRSENDPNLIRQLSPIAAMYARARLDDDARALYLRVISIEENNPPTARDSMNIPVETLYQQTLWDYGMFLQSAQLDPDAAALYAKMIALYEGDPALKSAPVWSQRHVFALTNYAGVLGRLKRFDEAQSMIMKAIAESENDPAHRAEYIAALQAYATVLREMNKPEEAAGIEAQIKTLREAAPPTALPAQRQGAQQP